MNPSIKIDFHHVFKSLPMPAMLLLPNEPHYTIIDVNAAHLTSTGSEESDVIGKGLFEAYPENPKEIETNGLSNLSHSINTVLQTREPHNMATQKYDIPLRGTDKYLTRYWNPLNTPVLNAKNEVICILLTATDVTAQELAKQKQKEAEELNKQHERKILALASIVESSEDAVVSLNDEGRIQSWNKGAENIYGYTSNEVIGEEISLIVPEELLKEEQELIGRVKKGEVIKHFETKRLCKNGSEVYVSLSISPTRSKDGKIIGISKIARDVSEQKRTNEKLQELHTELSAFTYSVSHDLRAPLRSIAGYAQILMEDYENKIDEEGLRLIQVVIRNAKRMGMLIDDLLNFSRMGKIALTLNKLNMETIVMSVIQEEFAENKKTTLEIKNILSVCADSSMIQQVWINLISNAIKYSAKNDFPKVEIGSFQEANEICYYVKDNGVGFDMKYYDKLFGVFQRLHKVNEFEGTGVGLALVKKIVERHNGRIWATGEINSGAIFYFTLPVTINNSMLNQ